MKNRITPQYLGKLIDFGPGMATPWKYVIGDKEMRSAQARGAAKIYNILTRSKVALLADEVGMGKTIQALSVCAALWQEKPNARVLIIAPREEVARNWMTEYKTFIQLHYRNTDHILKTFSDDPIAKPMVFCHNLYALTNEIIHGHSQLMIAKTSSFSSAVSRRDVKDALNKIGLEPNREIGQCANDTNQLNEATCKLLKKEIDRATEGKSAFDLMIIDEAHYYRNFYGDSLRVEAAKIFFGAPDKDIPFAKKTLLMTATPNHSSSEDIGNIVRYFSKKYEAVKYDVILNDICVRRLRRLSSKSKTKYHYRNEEAIGCNFEGRHMAELFFGLYQFNLVQAMEEDRRAGTGNKSNRDRFRRYLEGTEFIPEVKEDDNNKDSLRNNDFRTGSDSSILLKGGKQFREIFKSQPSHPKYDAIRDIIIGNDFKEKKVVFVRRINSVKEISKRVIEELDKKLWTRLRVLRELENEIDIPSRNRFETLLSEKKIKESEDDEIIEDDIDLQSEKVEEHSGIAPSSVLNLFKTIKTNAQQSTVASNFRKRFEFSKPGPFAMFFCPGEKDGTMAYNQFRINGYKIGSKVVDHYYESAFTHRISTNPLWEGIPMDWINRDRAVKEGKIIEQRVPTLITIFFELLQDDPESEKIIKAYHKYDPVEKEALSNFIAKGTLNASEDIVHLFIEFWKSKESVDSNASVGAALGRYLEFCNRIRNALPVSPLHEKIKESIFHFRTIYTKVFGISGNRKLMEQNWTNFNLVPIYPYSADNKNKEVRDSFNTPFYPNALVATSVLQEGVNLQYFCDKMYHYGAAWTAGDDEQRIGRIDRMFGKIERKLELEGDASLHICYPFLKDTVDENNLLRLFKSKRNEEMLLDEGRLPADIDRGNEEEEVKEKIEKYLRTPTDKDIPEPYTAKDTEFIGINAPAIKTKEIDLSLFKEAITNALNSIPELEIEIHELNVNGKNSGLVADPYLSGKRRQPVVIEYFYDPISTNRVRETVFTFSFRSPLQSSRAWCYFRDNAAAKKIFKELNKTNIKICLNHQSGGSNNWGLYLRVDIPVFVERPLANNPLSSIEICEAFNVLTYYTDKLEREVFNNQDIKKEDLELLIVSIQHKKNYEKLSEARGTQEMIGWKKDGRYINNEQKIRVQGDLETIKHVLEFNHNYPYIKFNLKEGYLYSGASILLDDAFSEEIITLEEHLIKSKNDFLFTT